MCLCSLFPDSIKELSDNLRQELYAEYEVKQGLLDLEMENANAEVSYISISFYIKIVSVQSDLVLKVNCC